VCGSKTLLEADISPAPMKTARAILPLMLCASIWPSHAALPQDPAVAETETTPAVTPAPYMEPEGESRKCFNEYRCCGGEKGSNNPCRLRCPADYDMRCELKSGQQCPQTWKAELEVAASMRGGASNWCCQCVHGDVDWDQRPCHKGCDCWNAVVPDGRTCAQLIIAGRFHRFAHKVPYPEKVRVRFPDVCTCSAQGVEPTPAP